MALTEIKLCGKLDLSMWRGSDDDEDKDSIDLSSSPLPGIPSNNNRINGSVGNLGVPTPQTPPATQKAGAFGSANSVPASSNFLQSNTNARPAGGESGDDGKLLKWDSNNLVQSVAEPNNQTQTAAQYLPSESKNLPVTNLERRENSTKDSTRGGVKKVEFAQGPGGEISMSSEVFPNGSREKVKGVPIKRPTRSTSGSLLLEIRKMSLASQDAEEEKKKQSSAAATSNITANKRVRRIRKRKREEEYTDKDRAAAVTLGSRDIKQSLKAKKKRERKMRLSLDFMSSEEYLASMLTVEALYQLKVRKTPQAALATLNKALELQPTHKGALVARSQCHIKLGDANSALKDAETSLGKNETFIQGLYHYAEALYQLGEFEKSLIAFHQGYRLRKDMECFRIGVQKSQDAIKRAIGSRTATQMSNLDEILSIIEELQESKRKAVSTCKDEDLLVNILRRRFGDKTISLTKAQSKQKNQWITREVLGQMYMDHQYLAKFIHRSDVKQQMGHAEELRETAKDGLNYLENREKFWRQQNPLYSRKMMANVINNNSLLAKLNSSSQQPPSTVPAANHNRVKSVNADKAGQTSFVSTPRLTMNNKVNRN